MNLYRRYYILLIVLTAVWCVGFLLAPALKHAGTSGLGSSEILYSFYGKICHQLDARSFHLAGEKWGVCIRCAAIYLSFFCALLTIPLWRSVKNLRVPPLWVLVLILSPMIADVVLNDLGLFPSSMLSRTATGLILGFGLTLFVVPSYLEACLQIEHRVRKHPPTLQMEK
jgi:uncharacterized membrane protein